MSLLTEHAQGQGSLKKLSWEESIKLPRHAEEKKKEKKKKKKKKEEEGACSERGGQEKQEEQEEQEDRRGKCATVLQVRLIRMCHSIFVLLVCAKECFVLVVVRSLN